MAPRGLGALRRLRRLVWHALLVVLVGGCAMPGMPDQRAARRSVPPPSGALEPWWRALGSPSLEALIAEALRESPAMASAEARLREAAHLEAARAGATRHPQVSARLGALREQASGAQPAGERLFGLFDAGVDVTYDFDLSGANREALRALAARTHYQAHRREAARLALVANIATAAITQAQLAEQLEAEQAALVAQERQFEVAVQRLRLGAMAPDETLALAAQVEDTRAALAPLRQQLAQSRHRLAVLAGRAPASPPPPFRLEDFGVPRELPVSVPSELVRRRPDVLAAEALLQAAGAEHGVAVARTHPQMKISASLGSQALTAAGLFGSGSLAWGLAAQLVQPLFQPGLRDEASAAEAAFDAAAAHYRETVLAAFGEVADAMQAVQVDSEALRARDASDRAAAALARSMRVQHAQGAASYLQLLHAEAQAQRSRSALAAAHGRRLVDVVAFYQAMGGEAPAP